MGTYTAGSDPNILAKTFTGSFQVPSTAYNGTVYGRAMLQFVEPNGEPIMCNSDPDAWDPGISAFEAGTVIDFKVKLTGGIDNPALANTGSDNASLGAIAAGLILGGSALTIVGNRRRRTSL
jgi:LPXTG-motif cell wall-anchored protein